MQMTDLKNKVAIVVGGAGAIGRATCLRLSNEGVKVVVADLNTEKASKIVDEIKERGCQVMAITTDIRNMDETDQMAKATIEYFGKIDILANIAGGEYASWSMGSGRSLNTRTV